MSKTISLLAFAFLLALLTPAELLYAQKTDNLSLQLNRSRASTRHHKAKPVPGNGEFKLSLGSQLFTDEDNRLPADQPTTEISRVEIAETFTDFGDSSANRLQLHTPAQLKLRSNRPTEQRRFAPTITLSSSYEDNAIGPNDQSASSLSIGGDTGRLSVYGQFEQQHMTTFSTQGNNTLSDPANGNAIRASVVEGENSGKQNLEPHEKSAALASRYYLEAVYSFKPTLKGKVSFKRSMIDTYESEEKLQVEGIVDANQNIQIKAGYKNEVRPEITDTKSSKDTKVWTEFILKF